MTLSALEAEETLPKILCGTSAARNPLLNPWKPFKKIDYEGLSFWIRVFHLIKQSWNNEVCYATSKPVSINREKAFRLSC